MTDELTELMRSAYKSYAECGVEGSEGARAMKEGLDRIEALTAENAALCERVAAMESGDWSQVQLVRFSDGELDLLAGPIPAIAEYMAQMMHDGKGGYFNNMSMEIGHKNAGPMVLTLQRSFGETPAQQRAAAIAERDALHAALAAALERLDASLFTNAEHQQAKDILRAAIKPRQQ